MDTKTIIAIVAGILLIGGGYAAYSYLGSPVNSGTTLQAVDAEGAPVTQTSPDDEKFLAIITNLTNITIDTSILSNKAFRMLTDRSIPIPPQPYRGSNPFVPFGGSASAAQSVVPAGAFSSGSLSR